MDVEGVEDAEAFEGVDADVDMSADAGDDVDAIDGAGEAGRLGEAGRSGETAEPAMVVPELEATGHVEVDAALERLRVLSERPTGAHPDLYDGVHQRLQEVLAQIDHQDAGR